MKKKRWYMLIMALPMLPLLLLPVVAGKVDSFWTVIIIATLIAAVPYVLFYIGTLVWMRGKTAADIKRASWHLPVFFAPVCGVFWLLAGLIFNPVADASTPMAATLLAMFCIPVGFFYVALGHLLTLIAQRLKLVKG